jgi:pseudaminic acid biosynthesis-associated methylase
MSNPESGEKAHAQRLEGLWKGDFGNAYTQRNAAAADRRQPFWDALLDEFPCRRVLEVGCNRGANLKWVSTKVAPHEVYGVDINESALTHVREALPGVNGLWGRARELPFRDRYFDMVFTMGVLIHQPPEVLPIVMSEIVRCSRKYVLAGEYFSESLVDVPYRGEQGALYKRDFGGLYAELFAELKLVKQGFLGRDAGWDDVTWWLFERSV